MASHLACIGLGVETQVELDRLLAAVYPRAVVIGRMGRREVRRWEDPSGARLIFRLDDGKPAGFSPAFAGRPGAFVMGGAQLGESSWNVAIVDADGEQQTGAAVDLEQGGLAEPVALPTRASIVALGRSIAVFPDAEAFAASPASLLGPPRDGEERPANLPERFVWPPRMGPESFISYGVFAPEISGSDRAEPIARMHGTVLASERRTAAETGQEFAVTRVRTAGMEVDLCIAGSDLAQHIEPGQVIGGEVYLSASIETSPASPAILGSPPARPS